MLKILVILLFLITVIFNHLLMQTSKAQILAQLQREILPLQGYKPATDNIGFDGGLGSTLLKRQLSIEPSA